mmetsp:Transcript_23396/g.60159  ORF Transcript_23396/g.60159 Transcript_23396/m.60159 type:complete len:213 (+) Transcript_23396:235-873(+)
MSASVPHHNGDVHRPFAPAGLVPAGYACRLTYWPRCPRTGAEKWMFGTTPAPGSARAPPSAPAPPSMRTCVSGLLDASAVRYAVRSTPIFCSAANLTSSTAACSRAARACSSCSARRCSSSACFRWLSHLSCVACSASLASRSCWLLSAASASLCRSSASLSSSSCFERSCRQRSSIARLSCSSRAWSASSRMRVRRVTASSCMSCSCAEAE